jgi:hypothetical protein
MLRLYSVVIFCAMMAPWEVRGDSPPAVNDERAFDIAKRSDDSDAGFGDSSVSARMILRNAGGQSTARRFTLKTLDEPDPAVGDKSLVIFESPRDIAGTALLSHVNITAADDQWLYLPSLKRVKRISTANKSGAFVGSEFAYEDFSLNELHKYNYAYVGEETIDGVRHDVIDRAPLYDGSGYSKQRAWIDKDIFQVRKIEFFDRRQALLKTLLFDDYRAYGSIWRSHRLLMKNHQTGKETELLYEAYQFGADFDRNDFSVGVLTQLR